MRVVVVRRAGHCAVSEQQPRQEWRAKKSALTSPVLQAGVRDLSGEAARLELGHRGEERDVLSLDHLVCRLPRQGPQELELGLQLRQPEPHHLIRDERLSEGGARLRVVERVVDAALQALEGVGRRPQPLLLKLDHLVHEALVRLADDILFGDAHVLQGELGGVRGAHVVGSVR